MSTTSSAYLPRICIGGCILLVLLSGAARGQDYDFSTIAGAPGEFGSNDGPASLARFYAPRAVTVDGHGNVFVIDTYTQAVRKITADGPVTTLDTSALYDDVDLFGTWDISGLAAKAEGDLFISHYDAGPAGGTRSRIWVISPDAVTRPFADLGSSAGGAFNRARGVAVDSQGNLYVAETDKHTIRKITRQGVVSDLAGSANLAGNADGNGGATRFNRPEGIAVDSLGNVFVADTGNNVIRKITADGAVTTFAGSSGSRGSADGSGRAAQFDAPTSVAADAQGNVYVSDTGSHTIRKIGADGLVTTIAGQAGSAGSADGVGAAVRFNAPSGVAVDAAGHVFVADTGNHVIRHGIPRSAPAVLAQPLSQTIARGRTAMLSATASGSPRPSYQWFKDGLAVDGGTAATLILIGVSAAQAGSYQCVASNAVGAVRSAPAVLSVVESSEIGHFNNFSTRAFLNAGRSLVAGFIVSGPSQKTVLVRGAGPALARFGVNGVLADPNLEIFGRAGRLAANDDWPAGLAEVFASTGAFAFPDGSKDAAILVSLPPGSYTAVLSGAINSSGEAMIEVFEVP